METPPSGPGRASGSRQASGGRHGANAIKAVLFDKDGTLIDFNSTWRGAFAEVALELTRQDPVLTRELLEAGGWDEESQSFRAGSLCAAGTSLELAERWSGLLPERPDPVRMAERMDRHFALAGSSGVKAVTPLPALFDELASRGIFLGIATSDSEAGATACLRSLGALDRLSFIAGYDSGHGVKPTAGMALAFCRHLGIAPSQIAVVGDNLHDMEMGRAAGAGLLVGVLSGTSLASDLEAMADCILPDISHLPDLLKGPGFGSDDQVAPETA